MKSKRHEEKGETNKFLLVGSPGVTFAYHCTELFSVASFGMKIYLHFIYLLWLESEFHNLQLYTNILKIDPLTRVSE
jgi:hypothetical protein